jgi:hypothetical protein
MNNNNIEDMPKHEISDKALNNMKNIMYSQDDFGIDKYGKPLKSKYKYDWLLMLSEELADGLKYLQCEMDRKADVIKLLEGAMRVDNPKLYVEAALDLLTVEGTGK